MSGEADGKWPYKLFIVTHSMQRWVGEMDCNFLGDFTRIMIVLQINIIYVK